MATKRSRTVSSRSSASVKRFIFIRRHKFLGALILLVVGAAMALLIVLQLDARRQQQVLLEEERRFALAEKEVADLTDAIIAATGQPLKVERDKSCFLRSVKYEKQPISCSISGELFYEVDDEAQANFIQSKVDERADKFWVLEKNSSTKSDASEKFSPRLMSGAPIPNDYEKINSKYTLRNEEMNCFTSSYLYLTSKPPHEDQIISAKKMYVLNINLDCGDDSSRIRYPER